MTRDGWIALALVVAAFGLRIAFLNDGLFHHDSIRLAQAVEASHASGQLEPMRLQEPPVPGRYGLVAVNWALFALHDLIGDPESSESTLLVSAAAFGSLAVGALFAVGRLIGLGAASAAAGGIVLMLTPIYFSETVGAKGHGLALLGQLLGLALATWAGRSGSVSLAAAAGIVLAATGLVRMPAVLALLPAAGLIAMGANWRRPLVTLAVSAGVMVALVATVQWEWITRFASVTGTSAPAIERMTGPLGNLVRSVTVPGLVLAGVGVAAAAKHRGLAAIAAWVAVGFVYAANLDQYSPRFLIEPVAGLCLLLGAAGALVPTRAQVVVPVLAVGLGGWALAGAFDVIAYRHDRIGNKEVALEIGRRTPPNAVVIAMDDAPFIEYYSGRRTLTRPPIDPRAPDAREETRAFARRVYDTVRAGDPVYLLKTGFAYDPGGLVNRALGGLFALREEFRMESEDYHHNSIDSGRYEQIVWRLTPRSSPSE